MKSFLIIFIVLNSFYSYSQDEIKLQISEQNNIQGTFEVITEKEYLNLGTPVALTEPVKNPKTDSIYKKLRKKYPGSFRDSLNCLILSAKNKECILCLDTNSQDFKGWTEYEIFDFKNGYLFFHSLGYEYECWDLYDPEKRLYKSVEGYHIFIGDIGIYFITNNEPTSSYFIFQSLKNNNHYQFYTDELDLTIKSGYYKNNKFYFEFRKFENNSQKSFFRKLILSQM